MNFHYASHINFGLGLESEVPRVWRDGGRWRGYYWCEWELGIGKASARVTPKGIELGSKIGPVISLSVCLYWRLGESFCRRFHFHLKGAHGEYSMKYSLCDLRARLDSPDRYLPTYNTTVGGMMVYSAIFLDYSTNGK